MQLPHNAHSKANELAMNVFIPRKNCRIFQAATAKQFFRMKQTQIYIF